MTSQPPSDTDPPVPGNRAAARHRDRPRSRMRRAVTAALTFTLLLTLTAVAVGVGAYLHFNSNITRVQVLNRGDANIRDPARQQNAANFLVIGSDTRAGADSGFGDVAGARSDTTMLVHVSPDRSRATIISIPRDSWVDVPACKQADGSLSKPYQGMFNSAFSTGGAACTISTVQKLTGLEVTHYVQIDFSGFEHMVDALHSVTVCSPEDVSDPMSGLVLHKGENKLGGVQALQYVRARENIGDGSDLGRIKRQQRFLGAVLRQALSGRLLSDPLRLSAFVNAATKAVTVDSKTSVFDLRTLASSLQGLDPAHTVFYTAPIADPDYSPPGTDQTGKVQLDAAQGRILYDAVIADAKPVFVTGSGTPTAAPSSAAPSSGAPTAAAPTSAAPPSSITAADTSCSL